MFVCLVVVFVISFPKKDLTVVSLLVACYVSPFDLLYIGHSSPPPHPHHQYDNQLIALFIENKFPKFCWSVKRINLVFGLVI